VSANLLVDFLFRLTFGIAVAMGLTPSAQVTSGFYRVHLWVLLGLQTLAVLVLASQPRLKMAHVPFAHWQGYAAFAAAVLCYVGATIWMYEHRALGKGAIWLIALLAAAGLVLPAVESHVHSYLPPGKPLGWQLAGMFSGALLLGLVTTAMLLGHWYLNTPTMKLAPLKRLILLLAAAVLVRAIVSGSGLWLELGHHAFREMSEMHTWVVFLVLRWLAGIAGVLGLAWLTWQTLKIPNTQSATGILYAAVVLALIGELTSQLLSAGVWYPV
jgi:hypothetical protein